MAFCNACGTSIAAGTKFCSKCGAAVAASSAAVAPAVAAGSTPVASAPPPASGGGALKVILIVVGVIVLVGVLSVASIGFLAWRVARHTHVRQDGDNVKVETPFGTVQTTQDPQEAARNLGVDLYPGAQILKDGSSSVTFGAVHTSTLNADTPDSLDKVCAFYKSRFPNAMVTSSDTNECNIVSNDKKNMVTISLKAQSDKTKIVIANVSRTSDAGGSSSN